MSRGPTADSVEAIASLLGIGVFARRSRLSPKALRLYDRLGLLVPAHVDEESGYRRYDESQLGADGRGVRHRVPGLVEVTASGVAGHPTGRTKKVRRWPGGETRSGSTRTWAGSASYREAKAS
jgi:hypothetical protein